MSIFYTLCEQNHTHTQFAIKRAVYIYFVSNIVNIVRWMVLNKNIANGYMHKNVNISHSPRSVLSIIRILWLCPGLHRLPWSNTCQSIVHYLLWTTPYVCIPCGLHTHLQGCTHAYLHLQYFTDKVCKNRRRKTTENWYSVHAKV